MVAAASSGRIPKLPTSSSLQRRRSAQRPQQWPEADDVDAHYEVARTQRGHIVHPPTDQPYGSREWSASDCEGMQWSFNESDRTMSEPLSEVEIEDFMQRWSAAIVSNDVDLINQFVTSDWVLIDRAGVITLERFNDVVATGTLRHTEMTHEIVFTRTINDESVVVLTHGRNAGTYDGQPIEADEWSLQLLVDTPSGWRCALTQLTPRP